MPAARSSRPPSSRTTTARACPRASSPPRSPATIPTNYDELVSRLRIRTCICARTPTPCAWCRGPATRPRRSSTTATPATAARTIWRRAMCCDACWRCTRAWACSPVIAPELEFFLVQKNTDPDFPLQPPAGRSGRPETARQSYSIDAVNEFDPILDLMYDYAEAMELDVDTLIHESGAASWRSTSSTPIALSRADQVFLFKRTHARSGDAPRHLRHLPGQADGERAGQLDAHPPEPAGCQDRRERVRRRQGRPAQRALHALPRRPAEIRADGDGLLRART